MKKYIIAVLFIIMSASIPFGVFADVSVGIGAGTPTSFVTTRLQLDRTTSAVINIGFGDWSADGVYIRPQVQFEQPDWNFQIERLTFYPYMGIAVPLEVKTDPDVDVSGVLGLSYYVADGPIEVYLEALPTFSIVQGGDVGLGLNLGASAGLRYSF